VLFIILLSCLRSDIVILDTLIVFTYLLTYLLTYGSPSLGRPSVTVTTTSSAAALGRSTHFSMAGLRYVTYL